MTVLRFPAEIAVGEVFWEDPPQDPDVFGHLLAIGVMEVPDEAVDLEFIRGLPADSVLSVNEYKEGLPASPSKDGRMSLREP